jgi:cell fate (sporulation/competence/biofilm development) regulator YlbF (YheA/YmcA/DUF963 family)
VDAVSAAAVNVNVAHSGAFDRFRAAAERLEQLRREGASPEELDQAVVRELITLIEALDDGQDAYGEPQ